ncbi:Ig-like domain repeat protein, partial [Nesterenkonia ebinurensis]|uniref:Ig-like domain repeat protein n=1 Tax=Nesterenkonia ebinurensis TaxID=2608252 RepID=UPI00168AF5ED
MAGAVMALCLAAPVLSAGTTPALAERDAEAPAESADLSTDDVSAAEVDAWPGFLEDVNDACDGDGEIMLEGDVTAPLDEQEFLDLEDCHLILDLNGHALTIYGPGENNAVGPGDGNAAIHVPEGASLTINDSSGNHDGSLTVTSGQYGAGIGSHARGNAGELVITGGTVNATSFSSGAGIGGGWWEGAGGTVRIEGGVVTASSDLYGAGIGGGDRGNGGEVVITGGIVTAMGGTIEVSSNPGAGIGAGADGSEPGSLEVHAVLTEDSDNDGASAENAPAPTITPVPAGDLYARAVTDQNSNGSGIFELEFGYLLTLVDLALGVDDEDREESQFLAFGATVPDQPEVPEGYTATGWRDAAPAGELVTGIEDGPVTLYSTSATASLSASTITAGEEATVTIEALNEDSELVDVTETEDVIITLDGDETDGPILSPTAAGSYDVEVQYLETTLLESELSVMPDEADSLVVEGPTEATEAETVTYTVELTDEHDNLISDVTGQVDVVSDVIGDQVELNQDGDAIEVTFVFTPEELVDRVLTFVYPVEGDEDITATVDVEVSSAVEDIELMVPGSASHGQSVEVGVTALGEGGEALGDVTDYAGVASDGDEDEVDGAEVRFTGAGERELTVTYRGHAETATVVVDQAATEVTAVLDGTTITAGEDVVLDVVVDSPVAGEHIPAGEVEVWLEDADVDEDEPLVTGELVDGEVTLEIEGLTEAEDYELVVRYPGTTDLAPSTSDPVTVTVVPAAPVSIEVTGPQNAVETATASYQVQAFDTYGNLIGNVTTETVVVSD